MKVTPIENIRTIVGRSAFAFDSSSYVSFSCFSQSSRQADASVHSSFGLRAQNDGGYFVYPRDL